MEIHPSARKHGIADADLLHATRNAVTAIDLDDESRDGRLVLFLGPDTHGNLLEVIAIARDDATDLASTPCRCAPSTAICCPEEGPPP